MSALTAVHLEAPRSLERAGVWRPVHLVWLRPPSAPESGSTGDRSGDKAGFELVEPVNPLLRYPLSFTTARFFGSQSKVPGFLGLTRTNSLFCTCTSA